MPLFGPLFSSFFLQAHHSIQSLQATPRSHPSILSTLWPSTDNLSSSFGITSDTLLRKPSTQYSAGQELTAYKSMGSTGTFGAIPQAPLTPPLTPDILTSNTDTNMDAVMSSVQDLPLSTLATIPEISLHSGLSYEDEGDVNVRLCSHTEDSKSCKPEKEDEYLWRENMTDEERDRREEWLASSRGRKGLRIVIVTGPFSIPLPLPFEEPLTSFLSSITENFLPKVDGVTRTLSRLLVHLQTSGHSCILLGPSSTIATYASHPIIGTLGIPLYCYPGLKLNFARPKFWEVVNRWEPDVVHFVDPIWLGAQMICGMGWGLGGGKWVGDREEWGELGGAVVASYHTSVSFLILHPIPPTDCLT